MDLPTCKTHEFTYHIFLYLTYILWSCVYRLLKQRLDQLQFSEVQNPWMFLMKALGKETDCCPFCHPILPPEEAWLRRAVRGQYVVEESVLSHSFQTSPTFLMVPLFLLLGVYPNFHLNKDLWCQEDTGLSPLIVSHFCLTCEEILIWCSLQRVHFKNNFNRLIYW